jgi:hypothetical protein
MTEFRVAPTASTQSRDRWIRLIVWSAVLVLSGITLFAVYGTHSVSRETNTALTWLAVLIVAGVIVGARFLAVRLGLERVERQLIFVLTDKDLVRRRSGWPDVKIAFPEINALYEQHGWLVVESSEPHRKIAIPEGVEGFRSLRAELATHHPIIIQPQRPQSRLIPVVASVLCWGLVLLSKDNTLVRIAGIAALILLAWESIRLYRKLRHGPERFLLWTWIGLGWVAAILVLYFRVVRRS